MTISFNGKPMEIDEELNVSELLESMSYQIKRTSVWMDGRQLLTSEYNQKLNEGCSFKALRILGGG